MMIKPPRWRGATCQCFQTLLVCASGVWARLPFGWSEPAIKAVSEPSHFGWPGLECFAKPRPPGRHMTQFWSVLIPGATASTHRHAFERISRQTTDVWNVLRLCKRCGDAWGCAHELQALRGLRSVPHSSRVTLVVPPCPVFVQSDSNPGHTAASQTLLLFKTSCHLLFKWKFLTSSLLKDRLSLEIISQQERKTK